MKTVYKISFEKTRHKLPTRVILLSFLAKFSINSSKDTKLSKHLVYLERKD